MWIHTVWFKFYHPHIFVTFAKLRDLFVPQFSHFRDRKLLDDYHTFVKSKWNYSHQYLSEYWLWLWHNNHGPWYYYSRESLFYSVIKTIWKKFKIITFLSFKCCYCILSTHIYFTSDFIDKWIDNDFQTKLIKLKRKKDNCSLLSTFNQCLLRY
jgi:hypothetical protein